MTSRGEQTRELLLDTAERLWGERGVDGVSLREIRVASGVRNTAAVYFYFHDRDGLIDALMARHLPRIAEIQQRLYDAASDGRRGRHTLVEILVRPTAEYVSLGPSERAWVKIMAELASLPHLHFKEMESFTPEAGVRAGSELLEQLRGVVPSKLARDRIIMLAQLSVHACADYARLIDHSEDSRGRMTERVFIANLVGMMEAALFAPPPGTR